MNENQLKLIKVMQQFAPKLPKLYKTVFGWTLVYGFGSSKGACGIDYINDNDVEELLSNGFVSEEKRLTEHGRQIR